MANIHILEGRIKGKVGSVEMGSYSVAYHIPIGTPDSNLTFPDFISAVPDISSAELTALQAGTLLEVIETPNYLSSFTTAYYSQRLKDRWTYLDIAENVKYNFRVKFYLTELAH